MQRRSELPQYKAILNPNYFDNTKFWKGIANHKNGKLERKVLHAEEIVKSIECVMGPSVFNFAYVYSPPLEDLIYMLSGARMGDEQDEKFLFILFTDCCYYPNIKSEILSCFQTRNQSILTTEIESEWQKRTNVINPYPNFIGHWNFELPKIEKEPLSSDFWLSVLAMAAGTLALIVAFAFLQAAAMSISGVAVAAIGTASLLGGLSIFRKDWQKHSYNTLLLREREIEKWRPATGHLQWDNMT